MNNDPPVPTLEGQFSVSLTGFAGLLLHLLEASLVIAVVTAALLQMIKEYLPMRNVYNRLTLRAWTGRRLMKLRSAFASSMKDEKTLFPWIVRWYMILLRSLLQMFKPLEINGLNFGCKIPNWMIAAGRDLHTAQQFLFEGARLKLRPELRSSIRSGLPTALYMKQIQNLGDLILGRPASSPGDFFVLAADADPKDLALVFVMDQIRGTDPAVANQLLRSEPGPPATIEPNGATATPGPPAESPYATEFRAAQDSVANAAERALDELQLSLTFGWRRVVRYTAVGLAILVVAAVSTELGVHRDRSISLWMLAVIGLVGGFLSTLLYDGITVFVPGGVERR